MSERIRNRRPATFKLDDPAVVVMDGDDSSRPARGSVRITPEPDPALPAPLDHAPPAPVRRGFRWGGGLLGCGGSFLCGWHDDLPESLKVGNLLAPPGFEQTSLA